MQVRIIVKNGEIATVYATKLPLEGEELRVEVVDDKTTVPVQVPVNLVAKYTLTPKQM